MTRSLAEGQFVAARARVARVWVSTWWRRSKEAPADFLARAAALGFTGVAWHGGLDAALAAELEAACLRRGTPVCAVVAPCPRGVGARAPYLATDDRSEREAAVAETVETLALAQRLGARHVIVALGALSVRAEWRELVTKFGHGEDTELRVERLRRQRRELSGRALDLCRFGLERILPRAADLGLRVAAVNRARWHEIPQGTELSQLVTEHAGSPLCAWIDPAAAHVRELLDFPAYVPPPRELCAGAWLSDASGLRGGLPWGRGEVDPAIVEHAELRVHHVGPDIADEELAALTGAGSRA
jgi:sugar phosphate isomerase/epimerase